MPKSFVSFTIRLTLFCALCVICNPAHAVWNCRNIIAIITGGLADGEQPVPAPVAPIVVSTPAVRELTESEKRLKQLVEAGNAILPEVLATSPTDSLTPMQIPLGAPAEFVLVFFYGDPVLQSELPSFYQTPRTQLIWDERTRVGAFLHCGGGGHSMFAPVVADAPGNRVIIGGSRAENRMGKWKNSVALSDLPGLVVQSRFFDVKFE